MNDLYAQGCTTCHSTAENWLCLHCHIVGCSRYVHSHMLDHHTDTGHAIVASFADLSAHCYLCEEYIEDEAVHEPLSAMHVAKFGVERPRRGVARKEGGEGVASGSGA
ncbi:Histone deacetylase 6 [Phlyctochytrium bullatum]|nr:Histone deacetylase 6 [Phlyctochytrium bullatum]